MAIVASKRDDEILAVRADEDGVDVVMTEAVASDRDVGNGGGIKRCPSDGKRSETRRKTEENRRRTRTTCRRVSVEEDDAAMEDARDRRVADFATTTPTVAHLGSVRAADHGSMTRATLPMAIPPSPTASEQTSAAAAAFTAPPSSPCGAGSRRRDGAASTTTRRSREASAARLEATPRAGRRAMRAPREDDDGGGDAVASSVPPIEAKGGDVATEIPAAAPPPSSSFRMGLVLILLAAVIVLSDVALLFADSFLDLPFDPPRPVLPSRLSRRSSASSHPLGLHSVCVPGAGFSGFWFTLGRLSTIPDPASRTYVCYSAGCLGVVALLSGSTMAEMADLALGIQRMWRDGEIGRYEVARRFVDGLLFPDNDVDGGSGGDGEDDDDDVDDDDGSEWSACGQSWCNSTAPMEEAAASSRRRRRRVPMDDPRLLSRVHVVTTTRERLGVRHEMRTPRTVKDLREMLVQTTWIPFATGPSLWSHDSRTGRPHMDGAFTAPAHPRCARHLGLPPLMPDLFLNALNVNLGLDKVEKYWRAGVKMGL